MKIYRFAWGEELQELAGEYPNAVGIANYLSGEGINVTTLEFYDGLGVLQSDSPQFDVYETWLSLPEFLGAQSIPMTPQERLAYLSMGAVSGTLNAAEQMELLGYMASRLAPIEESDGGKLPHTETPGNPLVQEP